MSLVWFCEEKILFERRPGWPLKSQQNMLLPHYFKVHSKKKINQIYSQVEKNEYISVSLYILFKEMLGIALDKL